MGFKLPLSLVGGADLLTQVGGADLLTQVGGADLLTLVGGADLLTQVGGADLLTQVGGADLLTQVGGADLPTHVGGADILTRVRAATRPAHQALEGVLGLLDAGLELSAYRNILSRFYGFWVGWEPQIEALLGNAAFSQPRRRLHLLADDLMSLGLSSEDLSALPRCPLVAIDGRAEAMGSLYVLEGSTLGGRLIARNLEHCFDRDGRAACRYFSGYGLRTGAMWRSFLSELERVPEEQAEMAARGATATFAQLGWWLTS